MCGIAGVFGKSDSYIVSRMLSTLAHRGPDDEHLVACEDFCLGARRLSIVDLAGGRQPMSDETGSIWVAQNGEIYNYPELRDELKKKGHRFRTRCDTEVHIHLYKEHGLDFPHWLDGMFSVALWDDAQKRGILVRDRTGKKPLYYYQRKGPLFFASEIKALLELPGFERRINLEALHYYLSYKHVPCPLSIFQDIHMLPPAHALFYEGNGRLRLSRYWMLDFSSPLDEGDWDEKSIADELIAKLKTGVKRRLMSDVPIGFFLSGGIDSGLSTALATEASSERVKTFTLVYPDHSSTTGKDQDRQCAREISEIYHTEHHEEILEFQSFPDVLPAIIRHFDEPFAGVVSTYFLSKLISRHVKVAISGDGADEVFGSYLSHRLAFPVFEYMRLAGQANPSRESVLQFEGKAGYLEALAEAEDWKWRYKLLVYGDEEKQKLYSPEVAQMLNGHRTIDRLKADFEGLSARDPLNRILEAEFRSIFPDQVLTFMDRLSMAHSLEVRTPFLDTDFLAFAARIPGALKIKNGQTKYILKKAALTYLPEHIVYRQKEGFLMPVTEWLVRNLEPYVRETLSLQRLHKHGMFDSSYVQCLVNEMYAGKSEYQHVNKVLALVVFQEWFDLYMD